MNVSQISTKASASILCGSNNLPDVRQTSDWKQVAVFRRLAMVPMTGCHVVVCHSGACGQSRQRGLCYIVCVCSIQVLSVDACDAANGLDVIARIQVQLLFRVVQARVILESQRMTWTRNLLVRSGTSVSSHTLHGFCQMWFVLMSAAYWIVKLPFELCVEAGDRICWY